MAHTHPIPPARSYSSNPESMYLLPSDEFERERLDNQHRAIKALHSSQLLPQELQLKAGDKVLDAGTGSGVWVLDVATAVPASVEIIGCDMESKAFPVRPPERTSFVVASVLNLSPAWSDAFVLVHQRWLVSALTLQQWERGLSELFRVAKPGGWIKLEEPTMDLTFPVPDEDVERRMPLTCELYRAMRRTFDARGLVWDISSRLQNLLKHAGFEDVHVVRQLVPVGPRTVPPYTRELLEAFYRAIQPPSQNQGLGLKLSDLEWTSLLEGVHEELSDNECGKYWNSFTARKPSLGARQTT